MLHTLVALADGDKHGYAILKEIDRRTDGAVRLSAGTLYAVVRRAAAAEIARLESIVEMAREKKLVPRPRPRTT